MKPTDEQLKDPKWWDENADSWQKVYCKMAQRFGALTDEEDLCDYCVLRPTNPAWDGEGLPPEKIWVEGQRNGVDWVECFYIGQDDEGRPWFKTYQTGDECAFNVFSSDMKLRPLRTPEQRQRDEVKRLIADNEHYGHDYVTDAILAKYELKERE